MKKALKIVSFILTALLISCVAFVVAFNAWINTNLSKREIFNLVEKYSDTITSDIAENNFDDTLAIKGVTKVNAKDVIEIQCGGKGFGSATSYYGFYFNKNDEPVVMFNGKVYPDELVPENKGYSYTESNSDNTYYTEQILSCFYYYEWHF